MARKFHPNLQIGVGVRIESNVELNAKSGRILIGDYCHLSYGTKILPDGGSIELGPGCHIGPYCMLYGHGGLSIGARASIGAHTVMIPANHIFLNSTKPICHQGLSKKGILIGTRVQIGSHVSVLDAVAIGDDAIIEHASVVSRSVPARTRVGGVPAKPIVEHRL